MSSTSSSDVLVDVKNLDVMFELRLHLDETIRGQFVHFLKNPVAYAMQKRDVLHVLKSISFQAKRGDRIAIIGKNGAGKTTLCRCLSGIYNPRTGSILSSGTVRSILDPSVAVYPELSGRENGEILARLLYPHLSNFKQHLDEALEFSGLGSFLDVPYRHYSNGMQTRLCLSVATIAPSDIFILDEVFEAADKGFKERISARILSLIERSGVVFFVSHVDEQIRRVCNKGLVLHDGKILYFGPIEEALSQYNRVIREAPQTVDHTP